ncbi:monodechloroaminopyrrolnitrin synthase PrnB family protein [Streptacidiphilus anmyonensis]|uniref:monodechloroaminopyrrolnitrin synthase PrnB family protein n=1 Tax=Streptacidiphilus anmyonensis TaxID=405782 RepID=UPI00128B037E|nr:monodechloroaminopyrrolnitrin synthase PrnB family protein [Streptacidiphilus anmyonensis]
MQLTDSFCLDVAVRDPLRADDLLAALPEVNARADTETLARMLGDLADAAAHAEIGTTGDRLAAMRDLGMLLGSLRRHEVEPLSAVPRAQPLLLDLGAAVGMAPRDTVLHYGPWNPTGPRRRMYLGAAEEHVLIDSVLRTAPAIEQAALHLAELTELDPAGPEFAEVCAAADQRLAVLPEMIGRVAREVDPSAFFAARLRPYMEDVLIDGHRYYGPAAAHVPLYLVDHLLWSCDRPDPVQAALQEELVEYGLPDWGRLYRKHVSGASVVTALVERLRGAGPEPDAQLLRSADAVARILRTLITFRGRHVRLVRQAYTDATPYGTGSAGAAPEVVQLILDLTRQCAQQLRPRLSRPVDPRP